MTLLSDKYLAIIWLIATFGICYCATAMVIGDIQTTKIKYSLGVRPCQHVKK